MAEFVDAVGPHGAAAVEVGVDQRGQGCRRLHCRVEPEAQLGEGGKIGAQAGGDDNLVHRVKAPGTSVDDQPLGCPLHMVGAPAGDEPDDAPVDQGTDALAELAAGGQGVVDTTAIRLAHALVAAPYHPGDARAGHLVD